MQKLQQQNNKNMFVLYLLRYTASTCENLSSVFANNKGADQTASTQPDQHLCYLNAFFFSIF